jgi:hypothetical protein
VDAYLPAALLHLREAEIVRLCGLARAARAQEYARTGRVRQAERAAGVLRASVLDGETARAVTARFAERGLDAWECSCSPPPDPSALPLAARAPCEHVAVLLYLWVREPERFRAADLPPDVRTADVPSTALASYLAAPVPGEAEPSALPNTPEPATAPARPFADLEPDLRRLLNLLALAGGSVTESEAERLYTRLELGEPEAALPALERLRQRGWVHPVAAAAPSSRHAAAAEGLAGWSIPEHLLALLPGVLPLASLHPSPTAEQAAASEAISEEADTAREPALETLPPEVGKREQRAEMSLPALLVLMTAQMVDRSAPAPAAETQKAGARSTLDLDAALAQQWAPQLAIAPEQARFCLGLLRLLGILPQTVTSRAGARSSAQALPVISAEQAGETLLRAYRLLLARPEAEVRRDLFTQWLNAPSARELVELRDAGVRVGWLSQHESKHSPDIAAENRAARQFIVNLLRRAPVGRWWNFSSLVEFVWRFQPAFLRGRQQTFLRPQWWLERLPEGEPLALDVRTDWRQGEGRYIALLVRRALHWLGVVDLALDEQGRLKGFRVTPSDSQLLGAAASGDGAPERAEGAGVAAVSPLPAGLQFQDDGTLLAPLDGLSAALLETLLCWCDPCGATRQGLRFRPSAGRVAAALDAGQDLEAWLAWLEQHPPGVGLSALVAQLRRWAALYGQVRLDESATLLEVADPALLRELEATLDLAGKFIDHTLSPGLALLRPGSVGALVEEMRRRGYSPWITDDETAHGN